MSADWRSVLFPCHRESGTFCIDMGHHPCGKQRVESRVIRSVRKVSQGHVLAKMGQFEAKWDIDGTSKTVRKCDILLVSQIQERDKLRGPGWR
jgi:hypothetical protein